MSERQQASGDPVGRDGHGDWRYEPRRSEVDGVPVVWADTPGPLTAGLVFRTGLIDEPFPSSGWTHAVQHLACARLDEDHKRVDARVELLFTRFVVRDEPENVVRILRELCEGLHDIDASRVDEERHTLAVEAERYATEDVGRLLWTRYGYAGPGRVAHEPWGYPAMTAARLRAWSADRFTRANATLWLSGPPPDELSLPLPSGQRLVPAVVDAVVPSGPHAVVYTTLNAACLLFVAERGRRAEVAGQVLEERLRERLSRKEDVAHDASVVVGPLNAGESYVFASAESSFEDHDRVARAMTEIVADLAEAAPSEEEMETAARRHAERVRDPELADEFLAAAAADVLLGPPGDAAESAESTESTGSTESTEVTEVTESDESADAVGVTADDVRSTLETASDTCLLGVRTERARDEAGWDAAPGWSAALPGGEILYSGEDEVTKRRLVVTDEGVGLHVGPDQYMTVCWRDCVGVASWGDGLRIVVGVDGFAVRVDPVHWPDGDELPPLIDEHAPSHVVAPQGSRTPDEGELEQQRDDAHATLLERIARARRAIRVTAAVVLVAFVVCVAALVVLGAVSGLLLWTFGPRALAVVGVLAAGVVVGMFFFVRRLAKDNGVRNGGFDPRDGRLPRS